MWADTAFASVLPRTIGGTGGATLAELNAAFPDHSARVPQTLILNRGISTELLAATRVISHQAQSSQVYVWQCNLRPGPAPATTLSAGEDMVIEPAEPTAGS